VTAKRIGDSKVENMNHKTMKENEIGHFAEDIDEDEEHVKIPLNVDYGSHVDSIENYAYEDEVCVHEIPKNA
jgi:hypothetical protein